MTLIGFVGRGITHLGGFTVHGYWHDRESLTLLKHLDQRGLEVAVFVIGLVEEKDAYPVRYAFEELVLRIACISVNLL